MRILYLLQDFPYPPTDGIRWKVYNLLSYMALRHECHVLSFGDASSAEKAEQWTKSLSGLHVLGIFQQPSGWSLQTQRARHVLKGNPPSLARWESQVMREAILQAANLYTYDVVHYDMVNMAQYRPLLRELPAILSTNDAMMMTYSRSAQVTQNPLRKMLLAFVARRFAAYDAWALREFTMLHVVSQIDADNIRARNPPANNVRVISHCVDPAFLTLPLRQSKSHDVHNRRAILFTSGSLRWPHIAGPLLRFVDTGFRQLRLAWPDLELVVIGRDAPSEIATKLSSEPGVRFAPWVEDYAHALETADIAIFLDNGGGGIKTRVIQALAAGKPVVGSPIALEGIAVTHGLNAYICESSDEVTKIVLTLMEDGDLRTRVGSAARQLINQYHTQEITGQQWETLYRSVTELTTCQQGDGTLPRLEDPQRNLLP